MEYSWQARVWHNSNTQYYLGLTLPFSPVFILCTPGLNQVWIADPEAAVDILARRNDFVKQPAAKHLLGFMGPNIVSVSLLFRSKITVKLIKAQRQMDTIGLGRGVSSRHTLMNESVQQSGGRDLDRPEQW